MQESLNRLWVQFNHLPAPLGIYCGCIIYSFACWVYANPLTWLPFGKDLVCSQWWLMMGISVAMVIGQALGFASILLLLKGSRKAISMVSLYVGVKGVLYLISLVTMSFQSHSTNSEWNYINWYDFGPRLLCLTLLCFGFLFYLERSDAIEQPFPKADRLKVDWWVVILTFATLLPMG